ncbi:MAG: hypothetical protein WKF67_05210, partial [Rubrobacteraceae bacterium]
MKSSRKLLVVILVLAASALAAGCGGGGGGSAESPESKELKLGVATGWDEAAVIANLTKIVMEEDLG